MEGSGRIHHAVALAALVAGILLRFGGGLFYNVPGMDEGVYAVAGLENLWLKWIAGLLWPPLAGFGARVASLMGREPIDGARCMALLFGTATLAFVHGIARELAPRLVRGPAAAWVPPMAAWVAAFAGSPIMISRFAVYDAMSYALAAASLYFLLLGLRRNSRACHYAAVFFLLAAFFKKYVVVIYAPLLFFGILLQSGRRAALIHFAVPLAVTGGLLAFLFRDFIFTGIGQATALSAAFQAAPGQILDKILQALLPVLPLALLGLLLAEDKKAALVCLCLGLVPIAFHFWCGHVLSIDKLLALSTLLGFAVLSAVPLAKRWHSILAPGNPTTRWWGALSLLAVAAFSCAHGLIYASITLDWRDTLASYEFMRTRTRPDSRILSYYIRHTSALMLNLPLDQVEERWTIGHMRRVEAGYYDLIFLTNEDRGQEHTLENGERTSSLAVLEKALASPWYQVGFVENTGFSWGYYRLAEPTAEDVRKVENLRDVDRYLQAAGMRVAPRDKPDLVYVLVKRGP